MNDTIDLMGMTKMISGRHKAFMDKYGVIVDKKIADRGLLRDQLYARLALVAKAFEKSGVSVRHEEVDVRSVRDVFQRSVALVTVGDVPVYMLNGCDYVVVTDGVVSEDPLSRGLVLLASAKHSNFMKTYSDVLRADFDWMAFSSDVLEAIHKVAYYSTEVMSRYFAKITTGKEDA